MPPRHEHCLGDWRCRDLRRRRVLGPLAALVLCSSIAHAQDAAPAPAPAADAAALFQDAVNLQLSAESVHLRGDGDPVPALLDEAVRRYREVLALKPDSAPAWYNLALIHQKRGETAQAREAYAKAAAIGGERQRFFQLQQANALRSQGDCQAAVAIYAELATGKGGNLEAHDGLVECYLRGPLRADDGFTRYLWRLLATGEIVTAREAALAALESGRSILARRELLSLVAESLGRDHMDPDAFLESEEARRIGRLGGSDALGAAPKELLAAFRADPEPHGPPWGQAYPAWLPRESTPSAQGETRVSARDAMTSLLLSLGDWRRQQGRVDRAESLYRYAALAEPERADARAIERLVDLYVASGRVDDINGLLSSYEKELFVGKSRAYLEGRPEQIYEFHRTLGELYGYLATTGQRPWGDESDPRSARFQLQHAYDTWKKIDQSPGAPSATQAALDPGVIELLARSYKAAGDAKRADTLRVEAAVKLDEKGDARGRDALIRRVDETTLSAPEKLKYEVLREQPAKAPRSNLAGSTVVDVVKLGGTVDASPARDGKTAAAATFVSLQNVAAVRGRPDILRAVAGSGATLTLLTSRVETAVPESAAQELASALAAWLEPRKVRLHRASRPPEQPAQVRSWDGSRGIAVLVINGQEVEIPFALASE